MKTQIFLKLARLQDKVFKAQELLSSELQSRWPPGRRVRCQLRTDQRPTTGTVISHRVAHVGMVRVRLDTKKGMVRDVHFRNLSDMGSPHSELDS